MTTSHVDEAMRRRGQRMLVVLLAGWVGAPFALLAEPKAATGVGCSWSSDFVGHPLGGDVFALAGFDDGGGAALYAGGSFLTADSLTVNHIAKWNGSSWSPLGTGVNAGVNATVWALAVYDGLLYAAGDFTQAGAVAADHIATWNGSVWQPLEGGGVNGEVKTMVVWDDYPVDHAKLYVGGFFNTASTSSGGTPADHLAQYRPGGHPEGNWVGCGVTVDCPDGAVEELYPHIVDHSTPVGRELFATGFFSLIGLENAGNVARSSNGFTMHQIGPIATSVLGSGAWALYSFAGDLWAGGAFTLAGGVPVSYVARWDGTAWHDPGGGMDWRVLTFESFNDGTGAALYAGGDFLTAGGIAANRIARWDGSGWSPLGSGLNGGVEALKVFNDGTGTALFAGGNFTEAGGIASARIAKWQCAPVVHEDGFDDGTFGSWTVVP